MTDKNLELFIPLAAEDGIICHMEMVLNKILNYYVNMYTVDYLEVV